MKLRELEQFHERKQKEPGDEPARELTVRSLQKRINQFKEEIARFEARAKSAVPDTTEADGNPP